MRKLTTEQFIQKAQQKHNYKYSYSKVQYTHSHAQVIITCPIHGDFQQTPSSHLSGNGCPSCKKLKAANQLRKMRKPSLTTEQFIQKAQQKYPDQFQYTKTEYINTNTPVIITCPIHGDFQQTPKLFLRGIHCKQCKQSSLKQEKISQFEDMFKHKSNIIHNNKYDYSLVCYTHSRNKVTIICPIHGEFNQTPNSHLQGTGCPHCNSFGGYNLRSFKNNNNLKNTPAILYFILINDQYYKIGITKRSLHERFKFEPFDYFLIHQQSNTLYNCFTLEQQFIQRFHLFQYTPQHKFDGYTECFSFNHDSLTNALDFLINSC